MKRDAAGKFVTNWDLETKHRVSLSLTRTAWRSLDQEARQRGLSRSEVIECFARSLGRAPETETAFLQTQLLAQQQELGVLQRQKQELETRLASTVTEVTESTGHKVSAILESITDAFVAFDRDWRYTYVNRAAAQILGRPPAELLGKQVWQEVFPELVNGIAYQLMHQALRDQVPVAWEEFGPAVPAWLEIKAYPSREGLAVYFRDVTARKQADAERERLLQALAIERAQFEAVLQQMPAGVLIADAASGKLVLANEQAKHLVRYDYAESHPLEDYRLLNPVESFRPDGRKYEPQEYPLVRSLRLGETVTNEEMELRYPEGGRTIISSNAAPILDSQGQIQAAVVVFQDITKRKQTEEILRRTETWLKLALSSADMIAWDRDLRSHQVTCSPNSLNVWGMQVGTVDEFFAAIHPEDQQAIKQAVEQAVLGDLSYTQEFRVVQSDGSLCWLKSQGRVYLDETGQPSRMTGVSVNITDRKQVEQERERLLDRERVARAEAEMAQQQLTMIFETSPVGLALLDAHQCFIAINEALAEINGLTREQHLGASITQLFGQVDPDLVQVFDHIYATGHPFISPGFAVNVPGRSDRRPGYYNVHYLPTTNADQQVEEVLIYVVDVTDQIRLERTQQFLAEASVVLASSLDYQTTLDQVAQLTVPELADWCTVHIVQEDGVIEQISVAHNDPAKLAWAAQLRDQYPLDPKGTRGAALTLRTGQSDFIPDIPDKLLVQAARDPNHLEILRQVGFSSVMTVPLRIQTRVIGVISFISAESGRRYTSTDLQLAEELARRASLAIDNAQLYQASQRDRAKAEAANRVKDEFLAVLSHELRSPLNPILGWTKLLRSQRLDAAKMDRALETIERNAQLQAQLVEDLLDVSRILQGKMTLNMMPVNLVATIHAALDTVRLAAEAKQIQIQTHLQEISGSVLGDAGRLQQVFWNLLSNAVKFTQAKGHVIITLEQVGMSAHIQIQDTGKGISSEFLPHVFDYFRQEDGTITRRFGGLGLGLAIVRQLTELHGGTVWVESPGQNLGATFTVQLPLNVVDQAQSEPGEPGADTVSLSAIRILVVDDDADMRELAAFILEQSGAQVITATSAIQALTLLNQALPDLLLCDIGMPEMDGYALIQQIRTWAPEQGGNLPAIALTAYAGEMNQQQALAAGFQLHIAKPVEPERLVQAIVQLLGPVITP